MIATTMDLRYKTKEIFKALDQNEEVIITHRGKEKGRILPIKPKRKIKNLKQDPSFGIWKDRKESPEEILKDLRKNRHAL